MKFATIRDGSRDGQLVLVRRDGSAYVELSAMAKTLQALLDDWDVLIEDVSAFYAKLNANELASTPITDTTPFYSPLPRAYEWVDGSAYINHIVLVRKARGAEAPATLKTDPLVYQGGSSAFLGPHDPIPLLNAEWGLDLEAEICVVLGDTPHGTTTKQASKFVRLLMLCNDVTLRNLIPEELKKGFGFFNSKPATAFSPFAVTPDELGVYWKDGRVHLPLKSFLNGELLGEPDAGPEMHFSFYDLIAHISKTRSFCAGTILGSGTVSNENPSKGVSCLAERRMREILEHDAAKTPFLKAYDVVEIEMHDPEGHSIFGKIKQKVIGQ
ncbi:MAG: fumarylacetoacetate hydrolase family protein [Myxococcales bacterium]|nr:MAG: fumarylacetoacetate hydrolase family protein [Myxococcales bacterium]